MTMFLRVLGTAAAAAFLVVPAAAATLSETAFGDFSGDFSKPTVIATGPTTIEGVWSGSNDQDILALTGLKAGAQTVTVTFSPVVPIGPTDYSFSAGGVVLYKTTLFTYSAWEGTTLANVGIQHWNRDSTFSYALALTEGFAGTLYLALNNTYGTLKYSIDAPGNLAALQPLPASPSAVPLPAAAPLLLAGLGALAMLSRRRRRV